ncbi:MAG: PepSY-associated TM helix domain-containing protein [Hyphomonadaceae bacterium]
MGAAVKKSWPDRRAFWRWHFYAGILCIPFVLWLAATGSIYLFRAQIENAIDAPYDHVPVVRRAAPSQEAAAALAAVPGARLSAYQLPAEDAAARVLVNRGGETIRVYVHPATLQVVKIVPEEERFTRQIFRLHGELMMGNAGSAIVELAACWAIVLIATGIVLWWPRGGGGAGVFYPRLHAGGRVFWRDLHAVTGMWVSALALFLLITGLPWAKFWGDYFKEVRAITRTADGPQDWRNGAADMDHAHHDHAAMMAGIKPSLAELDRLAPRVAALGLAPPVLLTPPDYGHVWGARSDAANRPLRASLTLDGETGAILSRRDFTQRHPIDQAVGVGVAAHEGQLFGPLNTALSLFAALGLIVLSVSAAWMWLLRRPPGVLGAPELQALPRFSFVVLAGAAALAALFPLLGASMAAVFAAERLVLRRIAPARAWLGLSAP